MEKQEQIEIETKDNSRKKPHTIQQLLTLKSEKEIENTMRNIAETVTSRYRTAGM